MTLKQQNKKVELTEQATITLNYNEILKVFAATKMIKSYGFPTLRMWATDIEEVFESKLKNPPE